MKELISWQELIGQKRGVEEIPLNLIEPNPYQPRHEFGDLEGLAQSIKEHGVLQPVVVRPHPTKEGWYQLIAGERRVRAAKMAGLTAIPAVIKDVADDKLLFFAFAENVQRKDLTPDEMLAALKEARRILALRNGVPADMVTWGNVAKALGISKSTVYNYLAMEKLDPEVREKLGSGLPLRTILAVASLPPEKQKEAVTAVLEAKLTGPEAEEMARRVHEGEPPKQAARGIRRRKPRPSKTAGEEFKITEPHKKELEKLPPELQEAARLEVETRGLDPIQTRWLVWLLLSDSNMPVPLAAGKVEFAAKTDVGKTLHKLTLLLDSFPTPEELTPSERTVLLTLLRHTQEKLQSIAESLEETAWK